MNVGISPNAQAMRAAGVLVGQDRRRPRCGASAVYQPAAIGVPMLISAMPKNAWNGMVTNSSSIRPTYGSLRGAGSTPMSTQKNRQPDGQEVHEHREVPDVRAASGSRTAA